MKKKSLLLCSVLLIGALCMAQRGDTLRKYLDDKLVFTNKAHSVYPGVAIRKSDGWLLVSLYPDTGVLVKAYLSFIIRTIYQPCKAIMLITYNKGFGNSGFPVAG
jgi:hypothetical protein